MLRGTGDDGAGLFPPGAVIIDGGVVSPPMPPSPFSSSLNGDLEDLTP
jgi:hypothetical protein